MLRDKPRYCSVWTESVSDIALPHNGNLTDLTGKSGK
jgi:hypothetical protein